MSALSVLLIAVGIGDVCRRLADNRWVAPVVAVATVVACALLGGLWHAGDVVLLVGAAAAGVAWLLLCDRVERTGQRHVTPLVVLGGAAVALILSLMVVGVMLAQLATGNELVRLVLGSVGAVRPAGQPQASDQLKGGRLLGPMERVLIVGLGLAGQLTMASAVVAAKSIIRFPEISANRGGKGDSTRVGIDDVTEYFLVGSFASWIVAFGGLALVH
jgi:hypothetical protein